MSMTINELSVGGIPLTYSFKCGVCGTEENQTWVCFGHGDVPRPNLPSGWRDVLGVLVCRRHNIKAKLILTTGTACVDPWRILEL